MIIDWKKKRKTVQKIEIITINSLENDKSYHNFNTVPPRREVRRQNTHFFIDQAYKRVDCTTLGKLTTGTMLPLFREKPLD
jgi:hypothetical protein